ncbi:mycothiol conjugate amidase Mca [Serinibacter arcticus]|uniref:Mycothiol S-conjugate amidase n=1 Tax=Serinibacter arcticus TaxID=1655435 RepID=A0A2U2A066_9MICO|nr:mycothiol conjugate amidase Mca [Serinibacter arcticus]PWD52619.1 mycothiol conjugate amidase Mca [Serinibacter arcticus]
MAVHAHPDDESSKGAATMARYAADGVDVLVVTCTGGERGDVLNPRLQHDPEVLVDLPARRRREMDAAAQALGVRQTWLGFVDSGLPEGDPLPPLPEGCFALAPLTETVPALVAQIREQRPQVLLTYDENGGYPHPDHIMTHVVSMAAVEAAADPEQFPELGEAWQVAKVYYHASFSRRRMAAVHDALTDRGLESPFGAWLAEWDGEGGRNVTCRVDASRHFGQRDQALLAHATQIDPDGFFFAVPRDLEADIWPWEEFELVSSTVPTEPMEDDLFAGVRE